MSLFLLFRGGKFEDEDSEEKAMMCDVISIRVGILFFNDSHMGVAI